jgi:hypothetical protein
MTQREPEDSVSHWLGKCEVVSEKIADQLDTERHRPGRWGDLFRRKKSGDQDARLAGELRNVHARLEEALVLLAAAFPTRSGD